MAAPPSSPFLDQYNTLDDFTTVIFNKLVEGLKTCNTFPADDDYTYFKAFRPFNTRMKQFGKRLLHLTQQLLDRERPDCPKLTSLDDADAVSEQYSEVVIDVVDGLVEQVAAFIDDAKGRRDATKLTVAKTATLAQQGKPDVRLFYGSGVARPQEKWKDEIDNSYEPFVPKITEKPNAKVPLDKIFLEKNNDASKRRQKLSSDGDPQVQKIGGYPHPYEYELNTLEYMPEQLVPQKEQMYKSLEETKFEWISTPEQLQKLIKVLETQKEIAVDLEHHAYRTYQGLTCLMQISTRTEDYIIDSLELWKHMHSLNTIFTNPKIVKVLHGADMDILWLQRDFGIYVVNLFDTGQASRVLDFPSYSLAFLLKHYCGVTADKKYQLADWRVRPLPDEMIKYAREDTHYLLYIYDRIKNEVIARSNENKNLLYAVLNRSRDLCLKTYEKEEFTEESYLKLYNKYNVVFQPQQLRVFAALYNWRDRTARLEDESTRYVLPNHMLFHIAEMMPEDMDALLGCCNPVPPLVRVHSQDILRLIKVAKESTAPLPGLPQTADGETYPAAMPAAPRGLPANLGLAALASGSLVGGATYPSTSIAVNGAPGVTQELVIQSTEHLVREAGWIDSDDDVTPTFQREATFAPINRDLTASNPLRNSLFSVDDDSSDEETRESRQTADAIRRSFAVDLFARIKIPEPHEPEAPVSAPVAVPTSVPVAAQPLGFTNNPVAASVAPTSSTTAAPAVGNEFDKIPQSMAEIYKLSNKNKKRKKKKKEKETKDESPSKTPQSPFYLNDGDEEIDIRAAKRQKSAETVISDEDSVKFMREIGWLRADEATPPRLHNPPAHRHKNAPAASAHKDDNTDEQTAGQNFTPYDYSKHSVSEPTTSSSSSSSFNPYSTVKFAQSSRGGKRGGAGGSGGHRGGHRRAVSGGTGGQQTKQGGPGSFSRGGKPTGR